MKYTITEIKAAWEKFKSLSAFCVLKEGKWENTPMIEGFRPPERLQATAARTRPLKEVMDFPEYLEKHWGK